MGTSFPFRGNGKEKWLHFLVCMCAVNKGYQGKAVNTQECVSSCQQWPSRQPIWAELLPADICAAQPWLWPSTTLSPSKLHCENYFWRAWIAAALLWRGGGSSWPLSAHTHTCTHTINPVAMASGKELSISSISLEGIYNPQLYL